MTPQIGKRAYELYEEQGRQDGRAVQDWEKAEREIRKEILDPAKIMARPATQIESEPEVKPETKAESEPGVEAKRENRMEPKTEAKTEPEPEEPKPETKNQ